MNIQKYLEGSTSVDGALYRSPCYGIVAILSNTELSDMY